MGLLCRFFGNFQSLVCIQSLLCYGMISQIGYFRAFHSCGASFLCLCSPRSASNFPGDPLTQSHTTGVRSQIPANPLGQSLKSFYPAVSCKCSNLVHSHILCHHKLQASSRPVSKQHQYSPGSLPNN